ncbi:uncharacterized protein EDB93DRAFT_1104036 [Suillus bovinus]|uniref:uncharacterized protein n=1 Tax=Suillus bovinus TaxID=48563 RepID=UPI001B867ECF|nr:uncharacterized protein EDB93DRAFT_1104036 [Suillus bovinus]KAG2147759.1 hypothetical protein EDB93DRAFT_1104036 [Suillus bovinus]
MKYQTVAAVYSLSGSTLLIMLLKPFVNCEYKKCQFLSAQKELAANGQFCGKALWMPLHQGSQRVDKILEVNLSNVHLEFRDYVRSTEVLVRCDQKLSEAAKVLSEVARCLPRFARAV